jgi:hypothetical protein
LTRGKLKLADHKPARFRFVVIEGSGETRSLESQHRTIEGARKAAAKWKAPASVEILDRHTGLIQR